MQKTTLLLDNGFDENVEFEINYHDIEDYQVFLKGINVTWFLDEDTRYDVERQIEAAKDHDNENCDRMEYLRDKNY